MIDSDGMSLRDSGNTVLADYGTSIQLGRSGEARTEISDTEISMYSGQGTPRKRVIIDNTGIIALGGATGADVSTSSTNKAIRITPGASGNVTIFDDSNNKAIISGSGMSVFAGGNQVAQFAATTIIGSSTDKVSISDSGITIRENDKDVISMASDVVTIGSSTDQVEINGTSGITIRENNVDTIALSGGSVVVGEVGASKSNVQITSGAINLRNNTTNKLVLAADGSITIGSNVSITSGGNVTLSGNITATAGNIGGWNIDGNTLKSDDNSIVT